MFAKLVFGLAAVVTTAAVTESAQATVFFNFGYSRGGYYGGGYRNYGYRPAFGNRVYYGSGYRGFNRGYVGVSYNRYPVSYGYRSYYAPTRVYSTYRYGGYPSYYGGGYRGGYRYGW